MIDEIWFVFFVSRFVRLYPSSSIRAKNPAGAGAAAAVTLLPGLAAMFQGGVLTGAAAGYSRGFSGGAAAARQSTSSLVHCFPPAFISRLGSLALTDWGQALAAAAEIGPIFLLLPLVVIWGVKGWRAGRIDLVLALGAAASFDHFCAI